jgi:hypothetical protein
MSLEHVGENGSFCVDGVSKAHKFLAGRLNVMLTLFAALVGEVELQWN